MLALLTANSFWKCGLTARPGEVDWPFIRLRTNDQASFRVAQQGDFHRSVTWVRKNNRTTDRVARLGDGFLPSAFD